MPDQLITTTKAELKLIVAALSAYRHNARYLKLFERLSAQLEQAR